MLVTGATGLVGANLTRALLAQGRTVRAVVHENLDPKKALQMYKDLGGTITHVKNAVRKASVKMPKKGKKK